MRAAKVQASLRIRAVSPEPSLLAHTSSEWRGTFRQKAKSLAPLNGWACAVKICHDGMLEDTNSLDGAHFCLLIYSLLSICFMYLTISCLLSRILEEWTKHQTALHVHQLNLTYRCHFPSVFRQCFSCFLEEFEAFFCYEWNFHSVEEMSYFWK